MNWQLKAVAFWAMDLLPGHSAIYKAFQRGVTGRYYQKAARSLNTYRWHLRNFKGGVVFEFGAGRNLFSPLLLSHAGAERIYTYDLTPLATVDQVNNMINQLSELIPGEWPLINTLSDLSTHYRIEYRAPADASAVALPDNSIDFFCTTSVFEHVPPVVIESIMQECLRLAKPDAVFSYIIDYHDHYATGDKSIGYFNFYKFSEAAWRRFNPGQHYQNRLRHNDYVDIFDKAGLDMVSVERVRDKWADADLARTQLDPHFAGYSLEDLTTTNGRFVMKPKSPSRPPRARQLTSPTPL